MKILVVSDNHGYFQELQQAIERESPFDVLMHCGDVCGHLSMALGEKPSYDVYAVAGNCDFPGTFPVSETVEVLSHRILLEHGHRHGVKINNDRLAEKAKQNGCDIALYGHTHIPEIEIRDDVCIINPGSLVYPRTRDGRSSYAVIQIDNATGTYRAEICYLK